MCPSIQIALKNTSMNTIIYVVGMTSGQSYIKFHTFSPTCTEWDGRVSTPCARGTGINPQPSHSRNRTKRSVLSSGVKLGFLLNVSVAFALQERQVLSLILALHGTCEAFMLSL